MPRGKAKKQTEAVAVVVTAEELTTLEAERAQAAQGLQIVSGVTEITDQITYEGVSAWVVHARDREKALTARRKEITDPLDASKKSTLDLFRPSVEFWGKVQEVGNRLLSALMAKQQAAQLAAQNSIRESGVGAVSPALVSVATGESSIQPTDGSYTITSWQWEFSDGTGQQATDAATLEYLTLRGVGAVLIEQLRVALGLPDLSTFAVNGGVLPNHDHHDRMVKEYGGGYRAFGIVTSQKTRVVAK